MKFWRPAARLPDALVGLIPVVAQPLDDLVHLHPGVVGDRLAVLVVEVDGVDQLAVDVELKLRGGAVSDPHRGRALVALEVVEHLLGEVGAAVDAVHDLERAALAVVRLAEAVGEPREELLRLLGEPERQERVHREGGVAHPGVAVVPVALAADVLGQARGRSGHDRAGRAVGEQLERQRRPVHHLAPAAAVLGVREPAPPEAHRAVERVRRRGLGRRAQPGAGLGLLEHERRALAVREREAGGDVVAASLERPVGGERHREIRRAEHRAAVVQLELVRAGGRSQSAAGTRARTPSPRAPPPPAAPACGCAWDRGGSA